MEEARCGGTLSSGHAIDALSVYVQQTAELLTRVSGYEEDASTRRRCLLLSLTPTALGMEVWWITRTRLKIHSRPHR
jgi:hypothetical protein